MDELPLNTGRRTHLPWRVIGWSVVVGGLTGLLFAIILGLESGVFPRRPDYSVDTYAFIIIALAQLVVIGLVGGLILGLICAAILARTNRQPR